MKNISDRILENIKTHVRYSMIFFVAKIVLFI